MSSAAQAILGKQLDLDLVPIISPKGISSASIQDGFTAFHAANPWVLTALENLTAQLLADGARKLGIGMLWEVVRWRYISQTRGDTFKANNNFRSRYVRLLIERHPDWSAVFDTREIRSP